jgi:hypothetical protein
VAIARRYTVRGAHRVAASHPDGGLRRRKGTHTPRETFAAYRGIARKLATLCVHAVVGAPSGERQITAQAQPLRENARPIT